MYVVCMCVSSVCLYTWMHEWAHVPDSCLIISTQGLKGDKGPTGEPGMNASTEGECLMEATCM